MTNDIAQQLADVRKSLLAPESPFLLIETERDGVSYQSYGNAPKNLVELAKPSRDLGEKIFISYQNESMNFADFFATSEGIAAALQSKYDIKKGDRIAIAMRNYPEWLCAFYAIVSVGAIAVPLNSWGIGTELIHALKDSGAKLLFADDPRYTSVATYLEQTKMSAILARTALDTSVMPGVSEFDQLLSEKHHYNEVDISPADPALILYTSGTTGRPKGALSTHGAICQSIFNFNFLAALAAMTSPATIEKMMRAGFDPVALLCLPLFHVSGLHSVFLLNLHTGRKIVMMPKWDLDNALDLIEAEQITSIASVPTMTQQLFSSDKFLQRDTSSLFAVGGGGAAAPPNFSEMIYEKKPNAFAGTGYGMTETNACGASSTGEAYKHKPRSTGLVSPIIRLEIRDENLHVLAEGEVGEIWLFGPSLMSGYWDAKTQTHSPIKNGWFQTGDIGYIDDEGFVFLVDRSKDMIIRGGENIYPAEIEAIALGHDKIIEAAAFGIPHHELGEQLILTVRPVSGETITEKELRDYLIQHLAAFKVPAFIAIQDQAFPVSATGKMMKKTLREEFLGQNQNDTFQAS